MAKIQDIDLPYLEYGEAAAPSTPASGIVRIYAKSDGLMYSKDDAGAETLMSGGGAGAVATDAIWDAAGDLAVGSGANTAAKLSLGATNGMALRRVSGAVAWDLPPGHEFDYVQVTSGNVSITATTEGSANTIVTANAVAYDGSTVIMLEFFCPFAASPAGNINIIVVLYDDTGGGAASIGRWGQQTGSDGTNIQRVPFRLTRRITPSNATHTYSVRAYVDSGTGTINNGAGGSGNYMPLFLRQTKV
jgi:hypothetical protein